MIDEREHFELIDGEIVPTAAAKFGDHEAMKSKLIRLLARAAPDDIDLFVEPSVTLSAKTLVEPDLVLWAKGGRSQEVRGSDLLLVIEVAVSSIAYDVQTKARLYARHGVRDYWVVDAIRRTIRVHRDPGDGGYADVEEYDADVAVAALLVEGVTIRLDQLD